MVSLLHEGVILTCFPGVASPQIGAWVFCCNTMLSENKADKTGFAYDHTLPRQRRKVKAVLQK